MQYSLTYEAILADSNADIQKFFMNLNILLPKSATGSCLTHSSVNASRIKFSVPRMKKQVSFTVKNPKEFESVLQTYNLAASLQDCVILFTLSGDILTIEFVTDSQETFKLLNEISTRLELVNK